MKRLFCLSVLLLATMSAFAQVEGSSVYLGVAMPRKTRTAGPSLGYKYQYNLPVKGLGIIGTIDFTCNRWEKDIRENSEKSFNEWLKFDNYDDGDVTKKFRLSSQYDIPINFGANYSYSFGRISAWGEGGIGFTTIFSARQIWKATEYSSVSYDSTTSSGRPTTITSSGSRHHYNITKYRPAVGFSWKIALGAMLDQKYSFGVYIDGVSKHTQKTVLEEDVKPYWNSSKNSYSRSTVSKHKEKGYVYASLRFGYHF